MFTFKPVKPATLKFKSNIINISQLMRPKRIGGRNVLRPIILGFRYSKFDAYEKARKIANKHRARIKRIKKANQDIVAYRATSLLNGAKSRAKVKGIDCTLTYEWIKDKLDQGYCEATGLKFIYTLYGASNNFGYDKYQTNPNAPSLDQIKPSEGYTPENTQVVISAFNKFKSDSEQHKLYIIAKAFCKSHMAAKAFRVDD